MPTRTTAERVLSYVNRRPKSGATRAEIARGTGLPENTVNPRVRELVLTGEVVEQGTRDGRAVVYAPSSPVVLPRVYMGVAG